MAKEALIDNYTSSTEDDAIHCAKEIVTEEEMVRSFNMDPGFPISLLPITWERF